MKKFVAAKLHGIHVTEADLEYHGSITLDPDHCEAAGILPMEFVDIWNKQSGARISTYVIYGTRGARQCILNGAAARTCQVGDQLIICSHDLRPAEDVIRIAPKVLTFTRDNEVGEVLTYAASRDAEGRLTFEIQKKGEAQPIPYKEEGSGIAFPGLGYAGGAANPRRR
jgi:aspartate 1-decarboxylase